MSGFLDRNQRSTHDVDGKIVSEKRGITEAAQRIAEKHDLPANWLNENATLFIPHKEDSQAATVFNSPNLVVTGASPRHLLAMKIDAGRPEDVEDIEWLIGKLKISRQQNRDTLLQPCSCSLRGNLFLDAVDRLP